MAAYAALTSLGRVLSLNLYFKTLLFDGHPHIQNILETAQNKIQSFEVFMKKLDSNSRSRMKDSLQGIEEAAVQFQKAISFSWNRVDGFDDAAVEHFTQKSYSFIDTLKKMEEEYLKHHTHLPHDEAKPKMVGLSDEYTKLKREIIDAYMTEFIFALVGMAGIGKTALANKLFQDLDILEWFDCCAWVTIGREYHQPQEIIQIILAQLGVDERNMSTEDCLINCMVDKRCLIVFDDVWDIGIVLKCLDPSNDVVIYNRSRILITTRIQPQHMYLSDHLLINMRLLNKQESWILLCDKIFNQNSCPREHEKATKMIAEKCDGLPLTILTVADLLRKTPRSKWADVATQKKHQLFIEAYKRISKVLYPSYDNLRENSKLCFLYMAIFPQNYEIRKSKLINLWMVEKFIRTSEFFYVECLQYLALHNVIMVYQRSSIILDDLFERIKTCRLHFSWWHFCYKEARKNKFFHILDSDTDASRKLLKGQSRLAIHNNILFAIKAVYKLMEKYCASTAHSLLCLGPYHQYPVPMCFGLKLLEKLDALEIRFYEFPLEVLELVKLRYLALTCNTSLPPDISKLWELQYLIVRQHLTMKFGAPSYLPVKIWDMKRLKHLHVTGSDLPDVSDTFLPNLLKLSDVSFNSCTKDVVRRIPNIKKLGIRVDIMPGAVEPLCCFDHVSHLSELESLKYVIVNPTSNFEVVAPLAQLSIFPINLKKLTLSGLGYPWKEMSTISSLPNLEVLKLRNNAFQGPLWEVEKDKFPKLSFLQIEDVDLEILEGKDSFKCLKKLSIKHCYNLRKLRFTMTYELIPNIEVVDCNPRIQRNIQKRLRHISPRQRIRLVEFSSSWNS